MDQLVSQIILPLVLAWVMFSMGLELNRSHFAQLLHTPKALLIGSALQLLVLPLLALGVIQLLVLPPVLASGLFLLALCPGGATSNLFSYLARGNLALSVSLTALSSAIVPFTLPLLFSTYLHWQQSLGEELAISSEMIAFPWLLSIKQLVAITLLPVCLGMLLNHYYSALSRRFKPVCKKLATLSMLSVIAALAITQGPELIDILITGSTSVLLLITCALILAGMTSRLMGFNARDRRTLTIEVGMQNAGIAMTVALSILSQPKLAQIPLLYGLMMNIPILLYVAWQRVQSTES